MNNFSELLATDQYLEIRVNNEIIKHPLLDPVRVEIDGGYELATIDGFEIKEWMGEVRDGVWVFRCDNFYQWKHQITGQGWLFYQNVKK